MLKIIKIYGQRNTNTNYLSKLVKLNIKTKELRGTVPESVMKIQKYVPGNEVVRDTYFSLTFRWNLGWKHTRVRSVQELKSHPLLRRKKVCFVTITKNPYSWLLSLYRHPYHQYYRRKPDFITFLEKPWKTVHRSNCERIIPNPIELWNQKNRSYLPLKNLGGINMTSREIIKDPEATIDKIVDHFSLEKRTDKFLNYEQSTKKSSKDFEYYQDYYLNERWKDDLSGEAIDIINKHLDEELMEYFGFQKIT